MKISERMKFVVRITILFFLFPCPLYIQAQETYIPNYKSIGNRAPLTPNKFYPLPLTAVRPAGWLKNQLQIQADGLTGHLEEFWPDLNHNSAWLGGTGEGWERGPYYLDGLVPIAYLLNDPLLIEKVEKWVLWTLNNQRADGSIGPLKNEDWWPNMIMLKVLTQYQEATGDKRVIPLLEKYFTYQAENIDKRPMKEWAIYRWAEELLTIQWLYNRNGDKKLLELANKLSKQGYDWGKQFENFQFTEKTNREKLGLVNGIHNNDKALQAHGVNNAMALKYTTLWSAFSGKETDRKAIYHQLKVLDQYHMLPIGMHSGDEHYAGKNPTQGVELCAIVEAMFSYEHLSAILGDPMFGDRLEKITYNALPATLSGDMWAHQYDQQPNQVLCSVHPREWSSNGDDANIFGLEPFFGCCTANMHQGWPKFVSHLWMSTAKEGLVAVAFGPCEVKAVVKGNVPVTIKEETEYPFRENIKLTISPEKPVNFPLMLRIPSWVKKAKVLINGKESSGVKEGSYFTIERQWKSGDKVELVFPMPVRNSFAYNNSTVIERGPLVFSLKIEEDWKKIKDREHQADDWEIHPKTEWNYALAIDTLNAQSGIEIKEKPIGSMVFSSGGAPVELTAKGFKLNEWKLEKGSAGLLPKSPVNPSSNEIQTITLIPYGSAKLRVTAFPWTTIDRNTSKKQ